MGADRADAAAKAAIGGSQVGERRRCKLSQRWGRLTWDYRASLIDARAFLRRKLNRTTLIEICVYIRPGTHLE